MRLIVPMRGLASAVLAVLVAMSPAQARVGHGGSHGGSHGGGHAVGHVGGHSGGGYSVGHSVGRAVAYAPRIHIPAAPVQFAPVVRSAPAMRTLPTVRHAQHVGRHHGAGKHARHRRGIGYVSFVDDGPYYYYDTYSDDDCAWLLRKARETGKRYWWQRYRECIEN